MVKRTSYSEEGYLRIHFRYNQTFNITVKSPLGVFRDAMVFHPFSHKAQNHWRRESAHDAGINEPAKVILSVLALFRLVDDLSKAIRRKINNVAKVMKLDNRLTDPEWTKS